MFSAAGICPSRARLALQIEMRGKFYLLKVSLPQTCGCQGGGGWRKEGLGVWDYQIQTIIYRMDKQQGPTVLHRELYSISCDKP